jgi:hypothetical protein
MPTIFNPYSKHEWFYNGPDPTIQDHEVALTYIKNKVGQLGQKHGQLGQTGQ